MLSMEYCAGFFDGEGYVTIDVLGRVRAGLAQKSREVLDLFGETFGLGTVLEKDPSRNPGFNWHVTGRENILLFLRAIRPHLIVKADEVDIAIEAAERIRENNLGCNPLGAFEFSERHRLRGKLLDLRNRWGIRKDATSREHKNRAAILESQNHLCKMCGEDLRPARQFDIIISKGIAVCRRCNPKRYAHEYKPVPREALAKAIEDGLTQKQMCEKFCINRSSLYVKIKKFGLPSGGTRRHWKRYSQGGING